MEASVFAAWWGAAIGSVALMWQMFTWFRKGPRLRLLATSNMKILTPGVDVDETLYVSVSVRNVGDGPTTLTHFCGVSYNGWFNWLRRKQAGRFVVITGPDSPIPFKLDPGETWSGMVLQNQVLSSLSWSGMWLYLGVQHSMAKKPAFTRAKLPLGNG